MAIGERFRALAGELDERQRRLWAAAEARSAGRGGISATARATGIAEDTIRKGIRELESGQGPGRGRVRRPGGGRKRITETDPGLIKDLERLVDAGSRGDPELPLRWTSKSVAQARRWPGRAGHEVSYRTVAGCCAALGYSLQANRKTTRAPIIPTVTPSSSIIDEVAKTALAAGQPVITVDTKKKELVGDFKNGGREWRARRASPSVVDVHDFPDELGQGDPVRRLRPRQRRGLGERRRRPRHAQFAVASIRAWWEHRGASATPTPPAVHHRRRGRQQRQPHPPVEERAAKPRRRDRARRSTSATSRPAPASGTRSSTACSASSSINWRGKPLATSRPIINLIAATTTRTGLEVYARLDPGTYPDKITITDNQLARVQIERDPFHPEWNYTINPRR